MSELSESQMQQIQTRLAEREADLQDQVRTAKEEAANRPSAIDRQVDDAGDLGEQRFRTGIEHVELIRDQEELAEIAEAHTRMAEGRYGECVDCGQPIAFERLLAQPTAKRCIADQEIWERKHDTTLRFSA